jgi:hypothetical protein
MSCKECWSLGYTCPRCVARELGELREELKALKIRLGMADPTERAKQDAADRDSFDRQQKGWPYG